MLNVIILISGSGSNLRAILEASQNTEYPVRVVAVGSDRQAAGLAHAEEFGVPTFVVRYRDYPNRESWGEALLTAIRSFDADLVLSAGLMRLLPANVVTELEPNLINSHPSLLPAFPGAHAVRDALSAGVSSTGVSVFVIDTGVDTGRLIAQREIAVEPGDTEETLHERIKVVERQLLVDLLTQIARQEISLSHPDQPSGITERNLS